MMKMCLIPPLKINMVSEKNSAESPEWLILHRKLFSDFQCKVISGIHSENSASSVRGVPVITTNKVY